MNKQRKCPDISNTIVKNFFLQIRVMKDIHA